jgi:hypothetical protein
MGRMDAALITSSPFSFKAANIWTFGFIRFTKVPQGTEAHHKIMRIGITEESADDAVFYPHSERYAWDCS